MKKFILGLLIGFMLSIGVTSYAVPEIQSAIFSDIKLIVNGEQVDSEIVSVVTTDNPNYMTNYVPARALSEALGAEVEWDGKNKVINVSTEEMPVVSSVVVPAQTSSDVQLPPTFEIRGLKTVFIADVYKALKARNYDLVNAVKKDTLQIVKDNNIVLKDITFILSNENQGYILYDFYETNILPLLQ